MKSYKTILLLFFLAINNYTAAKIIIIVNKTNHTISIEKTTGSDAVKATTNFICSGKTFVIDINKIASNNKIHFSTTLGPIDSKEIFEHSFTIDNPPDFLFLKQDLTTEEHHFKVEESEPIFLEPKKPNCPMPDSPKTNHNKKYK